MRYNFCLFLLVSLMSFVIFGAEECFFNFDQVIEQSLDHEDVKKNFLQPTARTEYIQFLRKILIGVENFLEKDCNMFCKSYPGFAQIRTAILEYWGWQTINYLGLKNDKMAVLRLEQENV